MPSCVVKRCKNNSTINKKSEGITYHVFPKSSKHLDEWIRFVRKSRKDQNWNPSKYSVICSSHFEDWCFYKTNKARKLWHSAIPTKNLFGIPTADDHEDDNYGNATMSNQEIDDPLGEPGTLDDSSDGVTYTKIFIQPFNEDGSGDISDTVNIKQEEPTDGSGISGNSFGSVIDTKPIVKTYNDDIGMINQRVTESRTNTIKQEISIEPFNEDGTDIPNTDTIRREDPFYEPAITGNLSITVKNETLTRPSNEVGNSIAVIDPSEFTVKREASDSLELINASSDASCSSNNTTFSFVPREPDKCEDDLSEVTRVTTREMTVSEAGSEYNTNFKNRLKKNLESKIVLFNNNKKEIKLLRQKVRRLEDRNKMLTNLLDTIKTKNLIDTDRYSKLNKNKIVAELFNNLNKNRLNRKLKFSPETKNFCRTLNNHSPEAYEYIRNTFNACLPHPKKMAVDKNRNTDA